MLPEAEYPITSLPPLIHDAVHAIAEEAQAPIPLVAAAALSAVSLVCQDLIDVDLYPGRSVPCSLFFLTVAESGERKSGVSRRFTKSIHSFQSKSIEKHNDLIARYSAELDIHKAIEKIIIKEAATRAKASRPTDDLVNKLEQLKKNAPTPPTYAKLLYENATPESLRENLASSWNSAGIISDEAEIVFNSRTFSNLQDYNKLWDGDALTVDRKGTGTQIIEDARLTISLMTQRSTLQNFLGKRGANSRGNGFLARVLFSAPQSKGPKWDIPVHQSHAPHSFNNRIASLFETCTMRRSTKSKRSNVKVSTEAGQIRALVSDAMAKHSQFGHAFFGAQDVTAKLRENMTRLAALLTYFPDGETEISATAMEHAGRICHWHLNQFIAFFPPHSSIDIAVADASLLTGYLAKMGPAPWKKNDVLHNGGLRPVSRLDAAIKVLLDSQQLELIEIDGASHLRPCNPFGKI